MRIQELLEGKFFNDLDYVKHGENGRELDYDLIEDLSYFMHNDDHAYRRHTHPVVVKGIDSLKHHKKVGASIFEPAVKECYKMYIRQYPIRELPDELDEETCKKVCDKLHEELKQHTEEGKYKD
jgi:hypothetical protein